MLRPADALHRPWDDPFWHALRVLLTAIGRRRPLLGADDVMPFLAKSGTSASLGLADWLDSQAPEMTYDLAGYLHTRYDLADHALTYLLRTEDEARQDFASISADQVRQYGTRLTSHHQSSKVMVQTVEALTNAASQGRTLPDTNPMNRVIELHRGSVWATARVLDGALPSLANPVGMWEIKEYWGNTKGGSKMSDAVYEMQLVGTELAVKQRDGFPPIAHYAIIDGKHQWSHRQSDLRRLVDLLYSGLLDGLIMGREVMTEWTPLVEEMWQVADAR